MSLLVDGITIILGYIVQEGNRIKVNEETLRKCHFYSVWRIVGLRGGLNRNDLARVIAIWQYDIV